MLSISWALQFVRSREKRDQRLPQLVETDVSRQTARHDYIGGVPFDLGQQRTENLAQTALDLVADHGFAHLFADHEADFGEGKLAVQAQEHQIVVRIAFAFSVDVVETAPTAQSVDSLHH